jgi:hypothetical protein
MGKLVRDEVWIELERRAVARHLDKYYRKGAWGLHDPDFSGFAKSFFVSFDTVRRVFNSMAYEPSIHDVLEKCVTVEPIPFEIREKKE